ncbi:3-hydroxybenzoate 6-hydroxylase [Actinocorallia aurea]
MTDVDVVVVGGGIGGLASAYALSKTGKSVRVLERSAEFAEVGAGLQMAPNAARILKEWGLLGKVLDKGVAPRRLLFKDAVDGSVLTRLDLDEKFVERYGAPYVVIHRSDLLDILADACREAGVELVPGSKVESVDNTAEGVVVRAGRTEHTAGLAVGADGLHSRLRARLSDDEPVCSGYVAYRGAFPIADLGREVEEEALHEVVVYLGPGCHLVQYALRGGEMFNTVAVFESPAWKRGEEEWGGPEELDEAFAECCDEVKTGLKSLGRVRRWPMYDRLPIPTWIDGNIVLTGDAAHPMLQYLAQGACQAVEDAFSLSGHLAEAEPAEALEAYQAERTARTARVQTTARLWGDIWHVDGVGRVLRNELFRRRDLDDPVYVDWLYHA